jgi:sigma-B regulation protein RsbU (phosphoserine phosphatase)
MASAAALSSELKYRLLLEISQKISRTFDLETVLNQILDSIRTVIDYDAAGVFVLNRGVPVTRYRGVMIAGAATVGFGSRPRANDEMLMRGRGIVGSVISGGEPIVARDVRLDPRYVEGRAATRSEIAVPIMGAGGVIGALNLESDVVAAYSPIHAEILEFFAMAASLSIEKALLHREAIERQHIGAQMKLAREVQANLLPAVPPAIPDYELAAVNLPTSDIGGDYYDYIPLDDGRLAIVIADVSGQGVPAALLMAGFRATLKNELRRETKPGRVMRVLHEHVLESAGSSRFVTAVYAVLDLATGALDYLNCGHNPPILLRGGGRHELLDSTGPALGMPVAFGFQSAGARLLPGDALVFYTDAVVEVTDDDEHDFGDARLISVLSGASCLPAPGVLASVVESTQRFSGRDTYEDDFTLMIVRRKGRLG